jgi:hypothetical protein
MNVEASCNMPEEHKHPDYEQTFARVATILDVIAQEQEEQARRGVETDARIDKLARDTDARARSADARIDKLAELTQRTQQSLQEFIEEAKIRDAETTDKLNGLIELMDRHLREHGGQSRP